MQKKFETCVRCGSYGPEEEFKFNEKLNGLICVDMEACVARKLRKLLVGV